MELKIGILGGMGPYATLDFIRHIYRLTPGIRVDSDHIRIISDINVKIPSRTRAVLYDEESPVKMMIESIEGLAALGASFVAVPCNSAHFFYDLVNENISIEWINMLEMVAKKVSLTESHGTLILGGYVTISKKIYDQYIKNSCYLDNDGNDLVFQLIEELKLANGQHLNTTKKLIDLCRKEKAKTIVLACTELTEVADLFRQNGFHVIDSNLIYAEGLVRLTK